MAAGGRTGIPASWRADRLPAGRLGAVGRAASAHAGERALRMGARAAGRPLLHRGLRRPSRWRRRRHHRKGAGGGRGPLHAGLRARGHRDRRPARGQHESRGHHRRRHRSGRWDPLGGRRLRDLHPDPAVRLRPTGGHRQPAQRAAPGWSAPGDRARADPAHSGIGAVAGVLAPHQPSRGPNVRRVLRSFGTQNVSVEAYGNV
jgi:hypothetical protein